MRNGDVSVELVSVGGPAFRELPNGQVLARPGQVYLIRVVNHSSQRAVVDVAIDGRSVTEQSLVVGAGASVDLERPIHTSERGRFTVVIEGDEAVFGDAGGRDNAELGLVVVRFTKERARPVTIRQPTWDPSLIGVDRIYGPGSYRRHRDEGYIVYGAGPLDGGEPRMSADEHAVLRARVIGGLASNAAETPGREVRLTRSNLTAAGTGLTGESDQVFTPVTMGALESTTTVVQLRLVVGEAMDPAVPRPLPTPGAIPPRPAARP